MSSYFATTSSLRISGAMDDTFSSHPRKPLLPHAVLEWLVKADIHGLTEGGTSAGNVSHLNPQLLDPLNYRSHHVASVTIKDQEGYDVLGRVGDVRYGFKISSTHAIITPSSIQALS